MDTIISFLAKNAIKNPDRNGVVDRFGAITWRELWSLSRRYALFLQRMGVRSGDFVMVECTQDRRFLLLDFACGLLGAVFVPLTYRAGEGIVADIVQETESVVLLSETEYALDGVLHISLDGIDAKLPAMEMEDVLFPRSGELAEILYTTGTTGKSKGIEMTHGANVALAENIRYSVEMKTGNTELIPLPISHSHGLRCCYANIMNGGTVVLTEGVAAIGNVLSLIERYHVTAMDISPSAALVLMKLSKGKLEQFRGQIDYIQVGTAVLQEQEREFLRNTFPDARLYDSYGSTESGRVCALEFNHHREGNGCIGRLAKNAQIAIIDENGEVIRSSKEHMGRLAFFGAMNMRGYFHRPDLTAEVMRDGYVITNDIGYVGAEGNVYLLGRQDDIINCGGIKISPGEIEEKAKRIDIVEDCACIAVRDAITGEAPKLFLVLKPGVMYEAAAFRKQLRKELDQERMPREIKVIDKIPRTENGKILRRELMTQ